MDTKMALESCPACDSSNVECRSRSRRITKENAVFTVDDLVYSFCGECAEEFVSSDQSRINKRLVVAAHKRACGILSGAEIRAIRLEKLRVSQREMASVLGVGVNTFSRYENDSVVPSDAMNSLLLVLGKFPEAFSHLAERKGLSARQPTVSSKFESMTLEKGVLVRIDNLKLLGSGETRCVSFAKAQGFSLAGGTETFHIAMEPESKPYIASSGETVSRAKVVRKQVSARRFCAVK